VHFNLWLRHLTNALLSSQAKLLFTIIIRCPKTLYIKDVRSEDPLDERPLSTTDPGDVCISSQTAGYTDR